MRINTEEDYYNNEGYFRGKILIIDRLTQEELYNLTSELKNSHSQLNWLISDTKEVCIAREQVEFVNGDAVIKIPLINSSNPYDVSIHIDKIKQYFIDAMKAKL